MIERAQRQHSDDRLEWQVADALSLPFEDNSFDVVVCQFGVMFFPDRREGFSEARRVLRPGGRFVFNSWGALEKNDFSKIAVETLISLYPADPPLFLARTPFGYSDASRIEADLSATGFGAIRIEEVELKSNAQMADAFAFGQTHGSPLRLEIEARSGSSLEQVRTAIADELQTHLGSGRITGRMMALVVEAVAP
jgi:SAM-dependent methyltransferase